MRLGRLIGQVLAYLLIVILGMAGIVGGTAAIVGLILLLRCILRMI